jgi:catechol 2,3-dioxygenase-like lactoylglutathione lyase family enzyme
MRIGPVVPILRIFDEAKAREFYVDFLGFSVDWEHRFEPGLPLYMQVSRSGCRLHLSGPHGDACPGSALRIEVADIDGLLADLKQRRRAFARPSIVDTPWGNRDMGITDPFGNRLCFASAIST